MMARSGMVQTVQTANRFVSQGVVMVGGEVCTDQAYLVGRVKEDWIAWVPGSKIEGVVKGWRGGEGKDDFLGV